MLLGLFAITNKIFLNILCKNLLWITNSTEEISRTEITGSKGMNFSKAFASIFKIIFLKYGTFPQYCSEV